VATSCPEIDRLAGAALTGALTWCGPGARGDVFVEETERITVQHRHGRGAPALARVGRGAALRVWNDGEVRFAAADGAAGEALIRCLRQIGAPAVGPAWPQSKPVGGAEGRARRRDADLEAAARHLAGLETDLAGAVPAVRWELTLEETTRRTWVAADTGVLHAASWCWLRLRVGAEGETGESAVWAGGSGDWAALRRTWPADRLAPLMARRLEGCRASAADLPPCTSRTPILFGAGNGAVVLHELAHGLEADAVQAGWSPWPAREEPLSPLLTVWDDPSRAGLRGSYVRDDEGSRGERELLVRRGRAVGCLGDRLRAEAGTGVRTGHGRRSHWQEWPTPRGSNLCLAAGDDQVEAVRGERGLLLVVHDLEAGATDPRSGELAVVISDGEWLDAGRRIGPVAGALLVGNVLELLAGVDRVCRDRVPDSGAATCSREGAGVPVGFLSPSFRTSGLRGSHGR
jgi:predicted Zn-dependent protease